MIQKCSIVNFSDNCGYLTGNVFHVYGGFKKLIGFSGDFLKVSIRSTKPEFIKKNQRAIYFYLMFFRTNKNN